VNADAQAICTHVPHALVPYVCPPTVVSAPASLALVGAADDDEQPNAYALALATRSAPIAAARAENATFMCPLRP
jgi:hypothetical protein